MGQYGGKDDDNTRRKRTPSLPSHEPSVQKSAKKQRRWKIIDPLLSRQGNDYNCFSHNFFCKSAQSSRGSRRNVWRIWIISRGKTRCGRTVEFLVCAKCDQDKRSFEQWWSCTKRIAIVKTWRTNWEVITTRQIEQILYGCRIPEYGWRRTVFHDERHWRILTIHRGSGLSWVHFAKRRRNIWTEGLDPREHQKLGSY